MESLSAAVIVKAMEGLTARIATSAENIANASTPNYRPLRVSFEEALASAARKGEVAVKAVKPEITEEPLAVGDGGVRLDLELSTDSSTAMRFSALIEVLNRQMQLQSLAITGNS